jgi:hypothetical protein
MIDFSCMLIVYGSSITQSTCLNRYGTPRPHEVPVPTKGNMSDLNYKTKMSFINEVGNKRRHIIIDDNDDDDDENDDDGEVDDEVIFVKTAQAIPLLRAHPDSPIKKTRTI